MLIALNPCKNLPLYTQEQANRYKSGWSGGCVQEGWVLGRSRPTDITVGEVWGVWERAGVRENEVGGVWGRQAGWVGAGQVRANRYRSGFRGLGSMGDLGLFFPAALSQLLCAQPCTCCDPVLASWLNTGNPTSTTVTLLSQLPALASILGLQLLSAMPCLHVMDPHIYMAVSIYQVPTLICGSYLLSDVSHRSALPLLALQLLRAMPCTCWTPTSTWWPPTPSARCCGSRRIRA